MPLEVIYTKSYNVWDDINPFLRQLAEGYVKSQETKWNNEWQLSAIADIERANKPQKVNSFLEMQKIPKENLDLEGFKGFATEAMNMLSQKEMTMNPEDFPSGIKPITDTDKIQTKTMPDVQEFNNLYKFVSELPTGKVDWTNTMGLFKEKLESGRAMGSAAQQFLSMIMGQSMPVNERQKVQQDFGFTQDIRNELFPKTTQKAPNTELEYWLSEHPGKGVEDYWKAKERPEDELKIDVEKFLEEHQDEWEFGSINSKGDFTIRRKDTTKKYDFKTYPEAQQWCTANPQKGFDWKIDPQPEGFNVTAVKKTVTPQGGTKKLIPTYGVINQVIADLNDPFLDYDTTMHNAEIKYDWTGVKLPTKAEVARNVYSGVKEEMFTGMSAIINENGFIKEENIYEDIENEQAYVNSYDDYEKYAKKYFEETGEILPKEYLSLEEAGKYTSLTKGEGKRGGYKSVINTENVPWSWQSDIDPTKAIYEQLQRENIDRVKEGKEPLTLDDVDLEGLAKKGVDIEKLKKIFGWGM